MEELIAAAGMLHDLWAAIAAAFGGLWWWWVRWRRKVQDERELLRRLQRLHSDQKAVLVEFAHAQRATLVMPPYDPCVKELERTGYLVVGQHVGPYRGINAYVTLRPAVDKVLQRWLGVDLEALQILMSLQGAND